MVTSVMWARSRSISAISCLMRAISSSALSLLNFKMRCIFISINLKMSSRVTSLMNCGLKGVSFSSTKRMASSMSLAVSKLFSL